MATQATLVSGRSVYTSRDGKTWILKGKTPEDKEHCWRMKMDKTGAAGAGRIPFYANCADPKNKKWVLPDVVKEEPRSIPVETPPPSGGSAPIVLKVQAPTKSEAEGVYTLSPETCEGRPVWITRYGAVLYSTSSGYWLAGTREAMKDNTGWVMSTDPHEGAPPHHVTSWSAFSGSQWIPDASVKVLPIDGTESPKETQVSGSSVYISEGGFWILEGKTLQDQPYVWKHKTAKDGTVYYVNPWNRVKVTALPDVVGDPHAMGHVALVSDSKSRSASVNSVGSMRARVKSQLETDLEEELEQHRRTIKCLEDKEALYKQQEGQLIHTLSHPGPSLPDSDPQSQLDNLEVRIAEEKRKLGDHPAPDYTDQRPPKDIEPTTLRRMKETLISQQQAIEAKASTLEDEQQRLIELEKDKMRAQITDKMQRHQAEQAVKADILQHHDHEMSGIHEQYMTESAMALQKHQEFLEKKAAALEQEHEEETLKLQEAARHLEDLAKQKQLPPADILTGAAVQYAKDLQDKDQRIATQHIQLEAAPAPGEAAEQLITAEQSKLQNEVNDFYLQTTQALNAAQYGLELKQQEAVLATKAKQEEEEAAARALANAHAQAELAAQAEAALKENEAREMAEALAEAQSHVQKLALAHKKAQAEVESLKSHTATLLETALPSPALTPSAAPPLAPITVVPVIPDIPSTASKYPLVPVVPAIPVHVVPAVAPSEPKRVLDEDSRDILISHLRKQVEDQQQREVEVQLQHEEQLKRWEQHQERQLSIKEDEMLKKLSIVKNEFHQTLRNSADEVKVVKSIAVEMGEREKGKEEMLLDMERKMADMQVEHETEKAKLLRALNEEVIALKKLLAESERRESALRSDVLRVEEVGAGVAARNGELKKEIVKMRMELSEVHDAHAAEVEELKHEHRQGVTTLRGEIERLRDMSSASADMETQATKHEIEKEGLLADHRRDVQAVRELMQREVALRDAQVESLTTELKEVRERHDEAISAVREKGRQEREDLIAELREEKKRCTGLEESLDVSRQGQREMQAAMAAERARGVQTDTIHAEDLVKARQGSATPDGDVKAQLTSLLSSEFNKLHATYIEPTSEVQTKLKRFRDRSPSRSLSADPSQASLPPYKAPSTTRSPSSSPYPQRPSSTDDLRRLQHLKEQMRQRLAFEQSL